MSAKKDELYKELKAATKQANKRMDKLERENALTPAYKIAANSIKNDLKRSLTKEQNSKIAVPRFKASEKMSFNQMQKELKHVNRFNNSASSTITGMKEVVKRRNETLYNKYGAKHLNSLYKILASDEYKKAAELLPSAMVVQAVSETINRGVDPTDIKSVLEKLIKSENDDYLLDDMNDMLDELE